jgi:hypothetical protein
MSAAPSPAPYYGRAASYYETARATGIDRTKTGLLLISIGFFVGWIPIVGAVGGILELVGAILVILGRHAFGPEHARNVMWSIIIFVIAIVVVGVAAVVAIFSAFANYQPGSTNPVPPNFASSFLGIFLVAVLIGIAIFGIADVLFTYGLQTSIGRMLLWGGYVSTIAVSTLEFFVLRNMPYLSSIPSIIPGLLYGYAYYLARDRIVRGELHAPLVPSAGR